MKFTLFLPFAFASQDVMIVLCEAMGLVADIL